MPEIIKFDSANLHEYFRKHYAIRNEAHLTDREGRRQIADGLPCLLLFHVLFQHPIRSQTVEQGAVKIYAQNCLQAPAE